MNLAPAPIKNNIVKSLLAEKVWLDWFTQLVAFVKSALHTFDPAWAGTATLVNGSITVANTNAKNGMFISLTPQNAAGTAGALYPIINDGVGFTINSTSPTDGRTVFYQIFQSL